MSLTQQKRIRDAGVIVGELPCGQRNKITDVPGVTVGHCTIDSENHHTGVTVVMPCRQNIFANKLLAAGYVWNGFGKTAGLVQIQELGTLETPIALTNTLNVGLMQDALVEYMVRRCREDGVTMKSINPVVGECNDSRLNDICERAVKEEHLMQAIQSAGEDFALGAVGAGRGTICHGLKGGIGSASRVIELDGKTYTLGLLVQSNHGRMSDLTIAGRNIGREIAEQIKAREEQLQPECDKGSIMMIAATDLPVSERQLGQHPETGERRPGAAGQLCGARQRGDHDRLLHRPQRALRRGTGAAAGCHAGGEDRPCLPRHRRVRRGGGAGQHVLRRGDDRL